MRLEPEIVIVGGGLAGLSAARTLKERGVSYVLLESEHEAGGLARSFDVNGFCFDCSGHLLHLQDPALRASVLSASDPDAWVQVSRESHIIIEDHLVSYPFQANLVDAPAHVRKDCIDALPPHSPRNEDEFANLGEWIDRNLGRGIAKWFMRPYNEKLFGTPVEDLLPTALGRFLPRVDIPSIVEGAKRRSAKTGYNAVFLYPRTGGIRLLPSFFVQDDLNVVCGQTATKIDYASGIVSTVEDQVAFSHGVISSIPLPDACEIAGLPRPQHLRARSVTCVNLGFPRRPSLLSNSHWVYLPGAEFHAFRIGLYDNISRDAVPAGLSGAYVEIAHWNDLSDEDALRFAIADLERLGAIGGPDDLVAVHVFCIPTAYVIMDSHYKAERHRALRDLESRRVHQVGRYGLWQYGSMEEAIAEGRSTALELSR